MYFVFVWRVLSVGQDYYEILGVTKEASEDEVKKSYKRLALQIHPDKNPHPESVEDFKKVGKAFEVSLIYVSSFDLFVSLSQFFH